MSYLGFAVFHGLTLVNIFTINKEYKCAWLLFSFQIYWAIFFKKWILCKVSILALVFAYIHESLHYYQYREHFCDPTKDCHYSIAFLSFSISGPGNYWLFFFFVILGSTSHTLCILFLVSLVQHYDFEIYLLSGANEIPSECVFFLTEVGHVKDPNVSALWRWQNLAQVRHKGIAKSSCGPFTSIDSVVESPWLSAPSLMFAAWKLPPCRDALLLGLPKPPSFSYMQ